ncbi:MAG: hypothetical protein H7Y32_17985 [Chloroflexales bacterium]|nr:hypothetical protein [Chloroflexales bacterium]
MLRHNSSAVSSTVRAPGHLWFMGFVAAWGFLVTALAMSGLLARLPTPLLPLPIAVALGALLAAYALVPAVRAYAQRLDMRTLTLFNVWRIPAALAFFAYGAQGLLPPSFVRNAGWGDLIAGAAAVPVALWLLPRPHWRRRSLVGFHLFSFADFVVAVGTGFTFSVLGDPLMATLKTFPMALIPLFGVPLTGALSVVALHRLATRAGKGAHTQ